MTRYRLGPGTPPLGNFDQTVLLGQSPPTGSAPCICTGVTMAWATSTDPATEVVLTGDPAAIIAADGNICQGTTFTFSIDWDGDLPSIPSIIQVGTYAWAFSVIDAGIATITPSMDCGGSITVMPPITAIVINAAYYSGGSSCVTNFPVEQPNTSVTFEAEAPSITFGVAWNGTACPADGCTFVGAGVDGWDGANGIPSVSINSSTGAVTVTYDRPDPDPGSGTSYTGLIDITVICGDNSSSTTFSPSFEVLFD